jgi:hypothetical protein
VSEEFLLETKRGECLSCCRRGHPQFCS